MDTFTKTANLKRRAGHASSFLFLRVSESTRQILSWHVTRQCGDFQPFLKWTSTCTVQLYIVANRNVHEREKTPGLNNTVEQRYLFRIFSFSFTVVQGRGFASQFIASPDNKVLFWKYRQSASLYSTVGTVWRISL